MNTTLISILAGLGGMLGWGSADFFANFGADEIGHKKTFFYSQSVALFLLGIVALFFINSLWFSWFLLGLTIFTGVTYTLGYLFFYKGFEVGNVSVVSAVINLNTVFTMLTAFFVFGQRLTLPQLGAIVVILTGVTLVSVDFNDLKQGTVSLLKGVRESVTGAAMFGFLFWPINEYIVERTDWVTVNLLTKMVAVLTVFVIIGAANLKTESSKFSKKLMLVLFLIGFLDTVGLLSVSFGLTVGDSILILPLTAALTLVTVGLAVIFLKEKLSMYQTVGILMTVAGIAVTAL